MDKFYHNIKSISRDFADEEGVKEKCGNGWKKTIPL